MLGSRYISAVTHSLQHGDHPDQLETGRCRPDLEGKDLTAASVTGTGITLLSVSGKVLARFFLDNDHPKLMTHQSHEQSGCHTEHVHRRSHPNAPCPHGAAE